MNYNTLTASTVASESYPYSVARLVGQSGAAGIITGSGDASFIYDWLVRVHISEPYLKPFPRILQITILSMDANDYSLNLLTIVAIIAEPVK
ncbi:MAG: hypothetical protein WCA08_07310 [Desulfoferrobacter sp.]